MANGSWRKIADEIAERIQSGELAPGSRIEPEEALAQRLGVSRHTAHRALHELQRQGLVFRQRRWGTVVADTSRPKSSRIAYLVDFAGSRFQADIMMHIEHQLDEGTRLVVATSKNDFERERESLRKLSHEVDGIICYPADGDANSDAFRKLASSGFPLVLIDRAPRGCEHLVVITDNVQASEKAIRDLVERGHRRIAFFGSQDDQALSVRERYAGFRAAVADLHYDSRPYERWLPLNLEGNNDGMYQSVSDALVAMRALQEPPTAAFCVQDRIAMGLIEACANQSLSIGRDFDIATYSDYGPSFLPQHRRLNRIHQQVEQISVAAVQRLKSLMHGEDIQPGPVRVHALIYPAEDSYRPTVSSFAAVGTAAL